MYLIVIYVRLMYLLRVVDKLSAPNEDKVNVDLIRFNF